MPALSKAFDSDFEVMTNQQQKGQSDADAQSGLLTNEKDTGTRENNVAKIKVVVRFHFQSTLPRSSLSLSVYIFVFVGINGVQMYG